MLLQIVLEPTLRILGRTRAFQAQFRDRVAEVDSKRLARFSSRLEEYLEKVVRVPILRKSRGDKVLDVSNSSQAFVDIMRYIVYYPELS